MRALVDTNVLVYALYDEVEFHSSSRRLLESAINPDAELCVTSQVLAEGFSIITNPKRVSVAYTVEDAVAAVEAILSLEGFSVLPQPLDTSSRWIELVRRRPLAGRRIFDVQLVATMLANNVRRIYTFNTSDFERFPELDVLLP